jgi:DNA-binding MarR family transcriptional regulator
VLDDQVEAILAAYPTLHAAWRRRGVQDQATGRRVSNHQAGILEQLDPAAPITVGELAQRLGVTPATISIQLVRLVRLRLVLREADPGDGRRVRIRLSEAGARMRNLRSLLDPERVRAALARLTEPEREAAIAGIRALATAAVPLPEKAISRRSNPRRNRRTPD